MDQLRPRFQQTLGDLLRSLAIPEEAIEHELREMDAMRYGLTMGTAQGRCQYEPGAAELQ